MPVWMDVRALILIFSVSSSLFLFSRADELGVIDDARAKADRELLMDERKYFIGQNNEKLFERFEQTRTYTRRRTKGTRQWRLCCCYYCYCWKGAIAPARVPQPFLHRLIGSACLCFCALHSRRLANSLCANTDGASIPSSNPVAPSLRTACVGSCSSFFFSF